MSYGLIPRQVIPEPIVFMASVIINLKLLLTTIYSGLYMHQELFKTLKMQ